MSKKQIILDTISDLVADLLWYNRKEDEMLQRGEIEKAVVNNEINVEEMTQHFKVELLDKI